MVPYRHAPLMIYNCIIVISYYCNIAKSLMICNCIIVKNFNLANFQLV